MEYGNILLIKSQYCCPVSGSERFTVYCTRLILNVVKSAAKYLN